MKINHLLFKIREVVSLLNRDKIMLKSKKNKENKIKKTIKKMLNKFLLTEI